MFRLRRLKSLRVEDGSLLFCGKFPACGGLKSLGRGGTATTPLLECLPRKKLTQQLCCHKQCLLYHNQHKLKQSWFHQNSSTHFPCNEAKKNKNIIVSKHVRVQKNCLLSWYQFQEQLQHHLEFLLRLKL